MIKWIRTSKLSIKNSLSLLARHGIPDVEPQILIFEPFNPDPGTLHVSDTVKSLSLNPELQSQIHSSQPLHVSEVFLFLSEPYTRNPKPWTLNPGP